jgi:glycosyltransferase involved in cell wall biosynthesis
MANSVVLVDPFEKGHHAYYAGVLAGGLSCLGWDIYVVGSERLISSIKKNCIVKGEVILSLSDADISEIDKYRYLSTALRAASLFQAQRIHLLTLDRMIGSLYFALFRLPHIKNLYATLHWGNILISKQKGWVSKVRARALRFMLNRLVKTRLVLMMHSPTLVSHMSSAKGRVGYVPYPHDIDAVSNNNCNKGNNIRVREMIPDTATVILCFGETRRDKGGDVAVRVLSYLPENYYLFIVGPEKDITRDEFAKIAMENGVSNRVKLNLSFVPEAEVKDYFLAADILLLPYDTSFCGQSGPLITAASLGLPVVVSEAAILKETVERYDLGVVVVGSDEELYADAIMKAALLNSDTIKGDNFIFEHSANSFSLSVSNLYKDV